MPRTVDITCPARTWTALTDADVDALTVSNRGQHGVFLQGRANTTAPTTTAGAVPLLPGQVIAADITLAQLFPGVSTPVRVFAFAPEGAVLSVQHA